MELGSQCWHFLSEIETSTWGFFIGIFVIVVSTVVVLSRAAKADHELAKQAAASAAPPQPVPQLSISILSTAFFFWLGTSYLVLLLFVGWFYAFKVGSSPPWMLGNVLPIAIPWFGAIGAVTISMAGVFEHSDQNWDRRYNYWHIGRPLFGAVLGVVAYFMFILMLSSAGTMTPILEEGRKDAHARDYFIFYVLAFLVGYREETFRDLIQRVTDLILKPATQDGATPQVTFKSGGVAITTLSFGNVLVNQQSNQVVMIENTGKGTLNSPTIALQPTANGPFTIASSSLGNGQDIKAGGTALVTVAFHAVACTS